MGKILIIKGADFHVNAIDRFTPTPTDVPTPSITISSSGVVSISSSYDVYYTTDGTTPTRSSSKYNGSFAVANNTTVKARAYNEGNYSAIASATYSSKSEVCFYDDAAVVQSDRYDVTLPRGNNECYDLAINESNSLSGKTITKIKAFPSVGKFSLIYWDSKPIARNQSKIIQTWNITEAKEQELVLDTPFVVQDGMYIGISHPTDTSVFKYNNNTTHATGNGFVYNAITTLHTNKGSLGVSYYGY